MYHQDDTVDVVRLLSVRKAYGKDRAQVLALDNVTAGSRRCAAARSPWWR